MFFLWISNKIQAFSPHPPAEDLQHLSESLQGCQGFTDGLQLLDLVVFLEAITMEL